MNLLVLFKSCGYLVAKFFLVMISQFFISLGRLVLSNISLDEGDFDLFSIRIL